MHNPRTGRTGRTNPLRFALTLGCCSAISIVMVSSTAAGALPISFALAGPEFKVSADRLDGKGFAQHVQVGQSTTDAEGVPVIVTGIGSATITNLCQSALVSTPLGSMTLRIDAGREAPVTASDLVLNLAELQGDVSFTGLRLGVDAGTVHGPAGAYAHQSDQVTVTKLRTTSRTTTAGTFRMDGMKLRLRPGKQECF
jgi:Family of unknown function (DUF6230)